MGQIIPFSEIDIYLESIEHIDNHKGTILDTNILISSSYEIRPLHEQSIEVLEILKTKGYRLFATVNTRSEYLEFQRRLILSENLLDITDSHSKVRISSRVRAKIQALKGSLKSSLTADSDRDEIFNDVQIKKIKKEFSAAFSDSMILNTLKSSNLFFIVTLDFDLGYAAISDPNMKDVVVPDRLYKEFKRYHFPI